MARLVLWPAILKRRGAVSQRTKPSAAWAAESVAASTSMAPNLEDGRSLGLLSGCAHRDSKLVDSGLHGGWELESLAGSMGAGSSLHFGVQRREGCPGVEDQPLSSTSTSPPSGSPCRV